MKPWSQRTRLLGALGDLKNLVKRSIKIVAYTAKFIADSLWIHRKFIGMCFRWDSKQRAPSAAELPRKVVMKMALCRGEEGHRPEGHRPGKA
jgi:hypothetical protein